MIETRPVHEQLMEICQAELAAGRYAVGERFPSERELAERHAISRATANKVISKLASEGWLELRKGLGAFVAERPTLFTSLRQMESFTAFAKEQGFQPATQVSAFDRLAAGTDVGPLPVALRERWADSVILHVERIRCIEGEPVIFERRWLPARRFPRLTKQMLEGSFYEVCRDRYGILIGREEAEIRAVSAPAHPAIDWNGPALRLKGTGFDNSDQPIWYQHLYYKGDRFTLLNRTDNAATVPQMSLRMRG